MLAGLGIVFVFGFLSFRLHVSWRKFRREQEVRWLKERSPFVG